MKFWYTCTAFFLLSTSVYAQNNDASIAQLVLQHVNHLRDSLQLPRLKLDAVLNEAALDHAYYLADKDKLTHFQSVYLRETPAERVVYYGGNRTYSGENVAFVPLIKKGERPDAEGIAAALYKAWFHSPGHYQNMVDPRYTMMGLETWISGSKVYAAQVFSSNEIRLPTSFRNPDFAWGVRPGEHNCKDDEKVYETMFFANSVVKDGRDIYLDFHDLEFFKKVISGDNDGLAIDVVLREQLPCHTENQFHTSEVHDGEMQRPIYKHAIFRNNVSSNPKKIRVKIGEVPAYLGNRQWDANVIIIKDNILCDYSVPMCLTSDVYPLLEIEPYFEKGAVTMQTGKQLHIRDTLQVELLYERSEGRFFALDERAYDQLIAVGHLAKNLQVDCFASVEGKKWYNLQLLEERRQSALDILSYFPPDDIHFRLAENWEAMHKQIAQHQLHELEGKDQDAIRYYLKKHPSDFYDSLLYEQRKTQITAIIDAVVPIDSYENYAIAQYYDSTITLNNLSWNDVLYTDFIHPERELPIELFDSLYAIAALKTNLLAAGAIDYANAHYDSLAVQTFVAEVDPKNTEQVFNYAHFLTCYWFAHYSRSYELKNVARTISPEELRTLLSKIDTTRLDGKNLNRLKINVLLSGIHYYVTHNQWQYVNGYFDQIAAMVKSGTFDAEEARELALFCNHFHKFKHTIEILDPFFERRELSEDGMFLLAETSHFRIHDIGTERYHNYMAGAKQANKRRYCKWLNEKFQIQRDEYLKEEFCRECK